ncbi:MAG TPA: ABC transporter substrate-binding protein [Candidatus Limnocylindria bacterium]|nr:ABC transporter substrate-binding protein [Candidatus Limnocylindria bacterium]
MKRNAAFLVAILMVLGACGGASGPGAGTAATSAPAAAQPQGCGPKGSGSLTILGTPQEEYVQGVTKTFEAECGIKMSYVRLSSGEALAKLRADKANPQFSVWWGGPADSFIAANKEGLLEAYVPKGVEKIPAQYRDANGVWTGIYVGALGLAVNTKVLKDKNLPEPTSWADLIKPIYKGQISIAHPASSGTSYTMMATQMFLANKDIEKGFAYMKAFHPNVLQYTKSGAAPARQAGQGEVAIGIVFSHDTVAAIEEGFKDLKVVFPSEGTGYEIGGMALVKGASDPIAAKTFMDWAITAKAQELAPTYKAYQIPTNSDAKVSDKSVKLASVKTVNYDFQWAGDNKKALIDRFSNEVAPQPR